MRLGSTGGLGRKRMWANGIGEEGGELVVERHREGKCVTAFLLLY